MFSSSVSPLLYEVYVRQWLHGLSVRHGCAIDLATVPDTELDTWARLGFTHVWLMGVWPTGPKSRQQAVEHADLRSAYDEALPGWSDVDVVGSPYAVSSYTVSPAIGGDEGLAALRKRMAARGIKLFLDLVPNHTGLDHPWATQRPHLYVGAPTPVPESTRVSSVDGERYIAHGKDPFFAGWTDTLQIDYRRPESRQAMIEEIDQIAARCDGVRCDMAMLALNDVFAKTWAHVPAQDDLGQSLPPCTDEFWWTAIGAIKQKFPDFLFLAEAYWDLEDRLCDLGFDYAYDKRLYDLVVHGDWGVAGHLRHLGDKNARRAHFLENHDEPRVNSHLSLAEHKAAALLTLSLPGLRFLHDGQLEGRRRFARIQLQRSADEEADADVAALYASLLEVLPRTAVGRGQSQILEAAPTWEGNQSHTAFTLLQWQQPGNPNSFDLVVINHSRHHAQCFARLSAQGLGNGRWSLVDRLSGEHHMREGSELVEKGLFLDTAAHAAQLFSFTRS